MTKVTVRLSESDITFLKEYAQRHEITVSKLIEQLRLSEKYSYHPDIEKFAGIISNGVDAKTAYYDYLEEKHK